MPGLIDKALNKGPRVAEELLAQAFYAVISLTQRGFIVTARQANATATGGTFQHHRIANAAGGADRLLNAVQQARTRRHRHLRHRRQLASTVFQAKLADLRRRRADKSDARRFTGVGKLGALGKEAIARINRLRAGLRRGRQDLVDAQIAVSGLVATERYRQISLGHVRRIAIGIGIDRYAGDAQTFQSADRPAGNFAAVGN
ncbi:hypothetical protein D3C81_421140 [compost metagenome]